MSLKTWILRKMNGLATRDDLPRRLPRSPVLGGGDVAERSAAQRDPRRGPSAGHGDFAPAPHLGPYAPLITAIREELEHFVASYLRLHLAIAERDRYLLTSIAVRATGAEDDAELLRRFVREFRPEQIKHYIAKEIIAALPNASAIDLAQFAGLNADRDEKVEADDGYSELLAELRGAAAPALRPFEVSLIGRWSEVAPAAAAAKGALSTPLAGHEIEIAIEDADGSRRVKLPAVVPGRRYSIGKGEGCDIVVNGVYASRRHCEIWLERGSWWVTDIGSTNGVRIERAGVVLGRSSSQPKATVDAAVIEVGPGARIVLSAHSEGSAVEYPRIMLERAHEASFAATPVAPPIAKPAAPATPATPILSARGTEASLTIAARMATGVRTVELRSGALPLSIGRSRSQGLVVDWAHEGVSGHHADITAIDDTGATVAVYGDNGVTVAGTLYGPGTELKWRTGEAMALGRTVGHEPECRLTLSRRD